MVAKKLITFVITILLFTSCSSGINTSVPEDLLGSWSTDNENYRDRIFQIQRETIKFEAGNDFSTEYKIKKLKVESKGPYLSCNFYYISEGNTYESHVIYDKIGNFLYFKNQPEIKWSRK